MNPAHLLEQAAQLTQPSGRGAPRQADLRRAVSASYYAVFHTLAGAFADTLAGAGRKGPRYELVYRSVRHARVRTICRELQKQTPPALYRSYWPASGFGPELLRVAALFQSLIEARHAADYSFNLRLGATDARNRLGEAGEAVQSLAQAPAQERDLFLTLLVCEPLG